MMAASSADLPENISSEDEEIAFQSLVNAHRADGPILPQSSKENCCKYFCEEAFADNPAVTARLAELKSAIEGVSAADKRRDLQFEVIHSWSLGSNMSSCFSFFSWPAIEHAGTQA